MSDCSDEEMAELMDDVGEIQVMLEHSGYYNIDSKIVEYANGLGLGEIGLDRDITNFPEVKGQKSSFGKNYCLKIQ